MRGKHAHIYTATGSRSIRGIKMHLTVEHGPSFFFLFFFSFLVLVQSGGITSHVTCEGSTKCAGVESTEH